MATAFENIISGVWPGRFEWADDVCVAFSTIKPIVSGHVLVVPRHPYPRWTLAPEEVATHLMAVARHIGQAQEQAFDVPASGLVIAGFEVPHTHLHVIPMRSEEDIRFANAHTEPDDQMDAAAEALREALRQAGHGAHVPAALGSPDLV